MFETQELTVTEIMSADFDLEVCSLRGGGGVIDPHLAEVRGEGTRKLEAQHKLRAEAGCQSNEE
jgi:hypothetical protein